jgi:hypothetical protein
VYDSLTSKNQAKDHALEIGVMILGAGVEYHYSAMSFASTDLILGAGPPGLGAGISLSPVSYIFGQAMIGKTVYEEIGQVGGPVGFRPDFVYGWRAGFYVPLNPASANLFLSLSAGRIELVQREYCENCVAFSPEPPLPVYGTKTKRFRVISAALVYRF